MTLMLNIFGMVNSAPLQGTMSNWQADKVFLMDENSESTPIRLILRNK